MLITAAPNASATPTAFQPPYVEQATPTSLYSIQVPTLEPFLPTPTVAQALTALRNDISKDD